MGDISGEGAFLGLDLGTTNIKAQIVGPDGTILSSGSSPVTVRYSAGGGAEQDIEEIWSATQEAVRRASSSGAGSGVLAIGVSSQGGALQVLDGSERPAGPVIGWQDTRGRPWDTTLTQRLGKTWFIEHSSRTKSDSAVGQLLRLREQGALPTGYRVGWVGDIVVGRMCGRRAHDGTSLSEAGLFNPRTETEDASLVDLLGIRREDLPALLTVDRAAGKLLPEIARAFGLHEGIPVGPAVHDQYAAATGCGVVRPGDTMFGAGTAWVLLAVTDSLEPPVTDEALACGHPVPRMYGQMLSLVNGGACVAWGVRTLNLGPLGISGTDALVADVPAGSDGLRFRPLLSTGGGANLPRELAGRLDGLRLAHTPSHILRALIEGLACELGRYLHLMKAGGVTVGRLVMCGGAAASTVTPGIIADTTGLPVDCVMVPETSSLGAAVFARGLVEPGSSLAALADEMKPPLRHVQPGAGSAAAQARLHEYISAHEYFNE
jgi:sugar (pentulose or hexulose) kinase